MRPFTHPYARGFSMVELLVAMLIGLIGMVIIFQVFEVSEGIKRTTTSGGDAQQNGAIALYVMEHDLRNSGMGFNDVAFAGCKILAYDSKRGTPAFNMTLAPVSITPGGAATAPDAITMFYGGKQFISNATMLAANMVVASDPLTLMNGYAYRPGDLFVLLWPGAGVDCTLMEATGVSPALVVSHDSGVPYQILSTLNNETARFNNPVGPGSIIYKGVGGPNVTRSFNLGNLYEPANGSGMPVNNTYSIVANALTASAAFVSKDADSSPLSSPVADNIVHLRAQYGLDDGAGGVGDGSVTFGGKFVAGDGLVDRFVSAATFNAIAPPPWQSVIAVRLAIVARSAQPEKPSGSDGTKCDATTDGTESTPGPDRRPTWAGSAIAGGALDVSASGDPDPASPQNWKCYRYRVFETTVPLRNWIWKSS